MAHVHGVQLYIRLGLFKKAKKVSKDWAKLLQNRPLKSDV